MFSNGYSPTSFVWTAEPAEGVVFSPDSHAQAPTVTVTKVTANPSLMTIRPVTTRDAASEEDRLTIEIYDTACKAAIGMGRAAEHATDADGNCRTDLADFVIMAANWLEDGRLTEPIVKPWWPPRRRPGPDETGDIQAVCDAS